MLIKLAGYNLDKSLIDKLGADDSATPEVISAAYARISRSSKSVTELRTEAGKAISKARASNQNIIFEMGHSSVAEHAVFNFDIIGISRYLAEFVQRSRLASFTEKSQRYVTLSGDYITPPEITNLPLLKAYTDLMEEAFALYSRLYEELKVQKAAEQIWQSKRDLEGAAKEDARYILPLCTKTQMGMTINARSLELLLRRLSGVNLDEAAMLRDLLYNEVFPVSPSLIRYTAADEFSQRKLDLPFEPVTESFNFNEATLLDFPLNADDKILAGLIFEQHGGNYTDVAEQLAKAGTLNVGQSPPADQTRVSHTQDRYPTLQVGQSPPADQTQVQASKRLTKAQSEKQRLWTTFFAGIKPWNKLPRAFELVDFTFELTMSSSCYAQFKRHRLCTILKSPYHATDGFVIPPSIRQPGQIAAISSFLHSQESLANELHKLNPQLYPYALTNAHRVRVIAKLNLREIYHFVRLRSDAHAQWEIQEVSNDIINIVKKHCPLACQWLMGKSDML